MGGLSAWPRRLAWELRRLAAAASRRAGPAVGWFVACAAVAVGAWAVERQQLRGLQETRQRPIPQGAFERPLPRLAVDDPGARLAAFERLLVPHADIPHVVRDLLERAGQARLAQVRGDYKAEPDAAGRFMRYRLSLPVKGEAERIQRYLMDALRVHPALALESVQFKRERIDSSEVEARVQWVLFTGLAHHLASGAPAAGGPP